jgi:hypothetical protein
MRDWITGKFEQIHRIKGPLAKWKQVILSYTAMNVSVARRIIEKRSLRAYAIFPTRRLTLTVTSSQNYSHIYLPSSFTIVVAETLDPTSAIVT